MRIVAAWLLLCGMEWAVVQPVFGQWQAGAAATMITPTEPMWMSGYASRNRPADGTYSELMAKALVLKADEQQQAVLITLDLVGVSRTWSAQLCNRLREQYGIERGRISICSSHTHSGPVVGSNLDPLHRQQLDPSQQKLVGQYTAWLTERVVHVVGQALENVAPAQLSFGSGYSTFAVNRRNNREADVPQLRNQGGLQGPVDHDVPVLAVRNTDGQLTAVVFGYACHATVLSDYKWCGDYPGYAQSALEQQNPDCVALFWAGCGGDQNPLPRRTVELAEGYGKQLADAVQQVLQAPMQPLRPQLTTDYRTVALSLDQLPSKSDLEEATRSDNRYESARARMLLEQWQQQGSLTTSYPYPIAVWHLGDQVQWVFLGGEVVVDYAVRLKSELQGRRTWVAGYANDVMAYIPSRRILAEGGYEGGGAMVYYGLPGIWDISVEEVIVGQVHEMARR